MVLIISEKTDITTIEVVRWLKYYGVSFIIIYPDTTIKLLSIEIDSKSIIYSISVNGKIIDSTEVSKIWYRRGELNFKNHEDFKKLLSITKNIDIVKHISISFISPAVAASQIFPLRQPEKRSALCTHIRKASLCCIPGTDDSFLSFPLQSHFCYRSL